MSIVHILLNIILENVRKKYRPFKYETTGIPQNQRRNHTNEYSFATFCITQTVVGTRLKPSLTITMPN